MFRGPLETYVLAVLSLVSDEQPHLIAPDVARLDAPTGAGKPIPAEGSPSYLFLAIVSILTLGIDLGTKQWAERTLDMRPPLVVVDKYMDFILARNKGGAWGLLQTTSELVRRPFFFSSRRSRSDSSSRSTRVCFRGSAR